MFGAELSAEATHMPYIRMLSDPGMNYTLNRPLLDGLSPDRMKEIGAVAGQIKGYESWHAVWLALAKRAEREKRWLDAASYYHGAEFYLPASDARNALYDDFARTWALGMKGVAGYEPIEVPWPGGHLPGLGAQANDAGKSSTTGVAVYGGRPSQRRSARRRTAHARLGVRLVRDARDAYHGNEDAVRFPHRDCPTFTGGRTASCQARRAAHRGRAGSSLRHRLDPSHHARACLRTLGHSANLHRSLWRRGS